ncbi:MAG: nucleotidyl transferase AbiEii/AbiGii toxin family protein [Deltaproteobacteria bacterium]|nr:nucleotidyl transferase AbiEii/AbiGii toxin family protein [Deltaproteobacteria bacterium]
MQKTMTNEELVAALEFTGRQTGFLQTLIEKDYYCSLVLGYLYQTKTPLIFKGGTCLNKIHFGFYRLSEDLDFSIPIESKATRKTRQTLIKPLKTIFEKIEKDVPSISIMGPLQGQNECRQYNGVLQYQSVITGELSQIKVEIGLREPLLQAPAQSGAKTILQNPFKMTAALPDISVLCLNLEEALAEKVRAAISRKEPAIRDYFDVHFANKQGLLNTESETLKKLIQAKLTVVDLPLQIPDNLENILAEQIETRLKPVLRQKDFEAFQLDKAIALVKKLASIIRLPD